MFYLIHNSDAPTTTATSTTISNSEDSAVLVPNPPKKPAILNRLSSTRSKIDSVLVLPASTDEASERGNLASSSSSLGFRNVAVQKFSVSDAPKTGTDMVCKTQYEQEMFAYYRTNVRLTKPEWTRERVNKVIRLIEEHKAPQHLMRRNNLGYHYSRKYDVMILGDQKFLIQKRCKDQEKLVRIVPSDEYFDILSKFHLATGHGGRDKMLNAIKFEYLIPSAAITIFIKNCKICQTKKANYKNKSNTLLADSFTNRGKIDMIDMRENPDGEYKWILHYQDGLTKFSFLRALLSDSLDEIASELLKLFLEVGCPPILETTRSRTFTAALIEKLEHVWPVCKILNGIHEDDDFFFGDQVQQMLKAWMCEMKSNNWSMGIYFVQFKKNTSKNKHTDITPFKAIFGRDPKIGVKHSQLNSIIAKANTEEDLKNLAHQLQKQKSTSDSTQNGKSALENESDSPNNNEMTDSEIPLTSSNMIKEEPSEECQEIDLLQSTSVKVEKTEELLSENVEEIVEPIVKIEADQDIKKEPDPLYETPRIDSSEDDDCVITDVKQELEIEICVDEEEGVESKRMKIII